MASIQTRMTDDHQRCDALFAEAEELVTEERWDEAAVRLEEFSRAMDRHFRMEEEALFPAFEAATGITAGPTEIMRSEHGQMRLLMEAMTDAANRHDRDDFLGQSETMLIIMQQHNAKEEQVLYPMADESITEGREHLMQQLDET